MTAFAPIANQANDSLTKGADVDNNTAWAIASGKIILPFTVRVSREQCLTDFLIRRFGDSGVCVKHIRNKYWKKLKSQGNRLQKVELIPVT